MNFIGIDPGLKGAWGWILPQNKIRKVYVFDFKIKDKEIDAHYLFHDLPPSMGACFFILEKAQAMPRQGGVSIFNYGKNYGKIKATLEIKGFPFIEIHPKKWKNYFKLNSDKKKSVELAENLFPGITFRTPRGRLLDGRAEALLIAEYGRLNYDKLINSRIRTVEL